MTRDLREGLGPPAHEANEQGQLDAHSRVALQAATLGTWDWNVTTDKVYWNTQHFELFGMSPSERPLTPETFFAHVYREDKDWLRERLLSCKNKQEHFEAEFRVALNDGTLRWMHGDGCVTEAVEGEATRMSGVMMDITKRKQAEEKLLESEAHFRTLAESLPFIVSSAYADGRIEYINPYWTEFSGRKPEDFISGDWLTAVHPEDRLPMLETWQRALLTGQPYEYEFRALAKDGIYRWLLARGRPVRNEQGDLLRWVNTALDIQDRKQAEAAVQKSGEELRAFISATSDTVYEMSSDWRKMHFLEGKAFIATTKRARNDWTDEYIPEEEKPRVWEAIHRAIKDKSNFELEHRVIRLDGTPGWTFSRAIPVFGAGGEIIKWFGTASDITWRKRAEEVLRESEERQRLLTESAKDFAIFTLDPERHVTSWSTGAERIFGYGEKEMIGQSGDSLFVSEDREKDDPAREAETARTTGHAGNERWHSRKDGTRFYGSGAVTPLHDETGKLLGFVKILRDLSEQKQLTETLQASENALQEADKRKDEFLAVLAHELRNPLAPIRTSLEIMKRTKNKEVEEEAKAIIGRQTDQLVHLVNDLLDVSRLTRGKIKLHKETFDLREIVEMALESTRSLIEEKEHDLQVSVPFKTVELYGDKTRLAQALLNLLSNAAKYTPPGGKISLSAVRGDGVLTLRVTDTGVGIPAKDLPHVFDLFVRVERSGGVEGLGIGLNLVKHLVEMHGGSVAAMSAGEGQGSEFTVRLPVATRGSEKEESQPADTKTADQNTPKATNVSQRVLVVDDYEPNRKTIARLLRLMGHEVVTAASGTEGLEQLESFKPEVMLLDLNMPGMSGFEVAQKIRSVPKLHRVKLIALTGYGQAQDKVRTRQAGFDAHLIKPVDAATLEALLGDT